MKVELQKRILTSIILIFLISLSLYLGPSAKAIAVLILIAIAYNEFNNLVEKFYRYPNPYSLQTGFKYLLIHVLIFWLFLNVWITSFILLLNIYDFIFVLAVCIFSDVGGYIVGKTIKGPKLTKISPNKTISGSIGSFLFSFIPLIILNYFLPDNFSLSKSNIIFCLEITIVCQLGDLFISYFKRKAKVKDTGKILPGHGGLLDRIDGIIFALPYASYRLYELAHPFSLEYYLDTYNIFIR